VPGPKRVQAIRICVAPKEADDLIDLLESDPKEAAKQLKKTYDELQPEYEKVDAVNKDFNEFDPERAKQALIENVKGAINMTQQNPFGAALVLGTTLFAAYAIKEWGPSWLKKGVVGTLVGGTLLVGANWIPAFFPRWSGGKTGLELAGYDRDDEILSGVTNDLKSRIKGLTDDNELSWRALMRLKHVKASSIVAAFEATLGTDPDQRTIKPRNFFTSGEIASGLPATMDPRGTYEGIEALMVLTAQNNGATGDRDVLAREGARIWRKCYVSGGEDCEYQYIIPDLVGIKRPARRNPDGSSAMGRSVDSGFGVESGTSTPQATGLESDFKSVLDSDGGKPVLMDVRHLQGDTYTINGYRFKITIEGNPGTKTKYIIEDPNNTAKHWTFVPETGDPTHEAEQIRKYVENKVTTDFKEGIGKGTAYTIEYVNARNRWEVQNVPASTDITNITKKDLKPTFFVVPGEKGYLRLFAERLVDDKAVPDPKPYATIGEAMKAAVKLEVKNTIQKDLGDVIGGLVFEVDRITPDPTDTIVYINYYGRKGALHYQNGEVMSYKLEPCPELETEWQALARKEASNFITNTMVRNKLEVLTAAFEGKQHAGGFSSLEGIEAYANQAWERLTGGNKASYRSQEAEWFETVQLQMMEVQTMVTYDFISLYHHNPTPGVIRDHRDFEGSGTLAKAAEIIKNLNDRAREIQNHRGIDADNIDPKREREMKALRESNYKNEPFKGLMADLDKEFEAKGWDAVGDENLAHARAIKDYIRWKIFDLAYPIPSKVVGEPEPPVTSVEAHEAWKTRALTDNEKAWIEKTRYQLRSLFAVAQMDPRSAGLFGTDRRYNALSFDDALSKADIKQFQVEYPNDASPVVSGVVIQTRAPALGSAPGGSKGLEQGELTRLSEEARKRIYKAYKLADAASWNPLSEHSYILKMRINRLMDMLNKEMIRKADLPNAETEIETLIALTVKTAEREGLKHQGKEAIESEKLLVKDALKGQNNPWEASAEIAFLYLRGNFKHETYGFIPAPQSLVYLMELYYRKIGGEHPEAYTNYFLTQVKNALVGQTDVSLDGLYAKSDEDWKRGNNPETQMDQVRALLERITPGSSWTPPQGDIEWLPELDNELSAAKAAREKEAQFNEKKKEVAKKFMKDFDSEDDLSKYFEIDGKWPDVFRAHVESRLYAVVANATDEGDLARITTTYSEYVKVEKGIYALLIKFDIDQDDPEALTKTVATINPIFKNAWAANANATEYSKVLFPPLLANMQSMPKNEIMKDMGEALGKFWAELPNVIDPIKSLWQ